MSFNTEPEPGNLLRQLASGLWQMGNDWTPLILKVEQYLRLNVLFFSSFPLVLLWTFQDVLFDFMWLYRSCPYLYPKQTSVKKTTVMLSVSDWNTENTSASFLPECTPEVAWSTSRNEENQLASSYDISWSSREPPTLKESLRPVWVEARLSVRY